MKRQKLCLCPICGCNEHKSVLNLETGNFDNSSLYDRLNVVACQKCGHIFNILNADEVQGLYRYYDEEYAPINLSSSNIEADIPGSQNMNTSTRHHDLVKHILPFITPDTVFLDIGCATGGLLKSLYADGYKYLFGVDSTETYVKEASKSDFLNIKSGNAEDIPFEDDVFDVVFLDQVIEHVVSPMDVFIEVKRVLVKGGYFCIGAPDAARYGDFNFFDYYWFLLREHIQHFDKFHLENLASKQGFELVVYEENQLKMMSDKMILPNMNLVFRLVDKSPDPICINIETRQFELMNKLDAYISRQTTISQNRIKRIEEVISDARDVYFWGLGREFFYIYSNMDIPKSKVKALIDTNDYKIEHSSIDGKRLNLPSVLNYANEHSVLFITALAHVDSIKESVMELGFVGRIVELEC